MVQHDYTVCLCVARLYVQNGCDRCVIYYFILHSQYEDRDNNIESACIEKKKAQTDTVDIKLLPKEEPGM